MHAIAALHVRDLSGLDGIVDMLSSAIGNVRLAGATLLARIAASGALCVALVLCVYSSFVRSKKLVFCLRHMLICGRVFVFALVRFARTCAVV